MEYNLNLPRIRMFHLNITNSFLHLGGKYWEHAKLEGTKINASMVIKTFWDDQWILIARALIKSK